MRTTRTRIGTTASGITRLGGRGRGSVSTWRVVGRMTGLWWVFWLQGDLALTKGRSKYGAATLGTRTKSGAQAIKLLPDFPPSRRMASTERIIAVQDQTPGRTAKPLGSSECRPWLISYFPKLTAGQLSHRLLLVGPAVPRSDW